MSNAATSAGTSTARTYQTDGRRMASKGTPARSPVAGPSKEFANSDYCYHVFNEASADGFVPTIDAIGAFVREHGPGCYSVDVHFRHILPGSVISSRAWGKVIHHLGGKVAIQIDQIFESK
jgi:hypothetical protein